MVDHEGPFCPFSRAEELSRQLRIIQHGKKRGGREIGVGDKMVDIMEYILNVSSGLLHRC